MNYSEFKISWNDTKEKIKQEFDLIGEDDQLLLEIKQNKILNGIQQKLGKTEEEIKNIISD